MERYRPLFISGGIIALLALTWAGFSTLAPPSTPAGGSAAAASGGNFGENVVLSDLSDLPDWLLVAYQRDCFVGQRCPRGEVKFNQRTISRNADGTADIWIQVRHGVSQAYRIEDDETRTTLHFTLERLHYRFNCTSGEFTVLERQIMGPNETIAARDEPTSAYRLPAQGSVTGLIQPIACRGG
ncbi:MAG: hypothetical protein ABL883_02340 [Terricaulis sp.]